MNAIIWLEPWQQNDEYSFHSSCIWASRRERAPPAFYWLCVIRFQKRPGNTMGKKKNAFPGGKWKLIRNGTLWHGTQWNSREHGGPIFTALPSIQAWCGEPRLGWNENKFSAARFDEFYPATRWKRSISLIFSGFHNPGSMCHKEGKASMGQGAKMRVWSKGKKVDLWAFDRTGCR